MINREQAYFFKADVIEIFIPLPENLENLLFLFLAEKEDSSFKFQIKFYK